MPNVEAAIEQTIEAGTHQWAHCLWSRASAQTYSVSKPNGYIHVSSSACHNIQILMYICIVILGDDDL